MFPLSGCLQSLRGLVLSLLFGSGESVAHRLRGTFSPAALFPDALLPPDTIRDPSVRLET